MKIEISTTLKCSPEAVWEAVRTTQLFRYITRPLLTFEPIDPPTWPTVWDAGAYRCRIKFLGLVPLGSQTIDISFLAATGPEAAHPIYRVRDNGRGDLAKRWDHLITIEGTDQGTTQSTDRVEVEAGLLTPGVWAFAQLFYRYRQARWRRLVRHDFDYNA